MLHLAGFLWKCATRGGHSDGSRSATGGDELTAARRTILPAREFGFFRVTLSILRSVQSHASGLSRIRTLPNSAVLTFSNYQVQAFTCLSWLSS